MIDGRLHRLDVSATMTRPPMTLTRRSALETIALAAAGLAFPACRSSVTGAQPREPRLAARPGSPVETGPTGTSSFGVPSSSAVIHVPAAVDRAVAAPLLVFLHGAGRTVDAFVEAHRAGADAAGVIVLAPYSAGDTWDAIRGTFSTDVGILDAVLEWTFRRWTIDAERIVMSGFSDGATYSLGIGRANGDLFARVVAYSPGRLLDVENVGRPAILVTHGTADNVLPISASRGIVRELRSDGYEVEFREFEGGHVVRQSDVDDVIAALNSPASP
jgi:predicted esterase